MLFFVFLFLCSSEAFSVAEDELIAVSLLYRHGDRTPLKFYANDPYKDPSYWPVAPGELTNVGKLQQYELGKWLRNRYGNFLSQIYNKDEIYIRSSDDDRCLMSAESNLAALYPPQSTDIWNPALLWQPIPVHTIPPKLDDIAEVQHSCPKYKGLKKAAEQLPYFKDINEKNKELYEYLTQNIGENVINLTGADDLYDTLLIEQINNFTLPSWTNEVLPQLQEIGDITPKLLSYTPQLGRLFLGRFFHHVISQFQYFEDVFPNDSDETEYKFRVYSAHDDQVFSILNVLKVENLKKVPFAAVVILELRENPKGERYVQVLYKTKPDVADVVQVEGCDTKCNLAKFLEIIEPYSLTKDEFSKECN